jgi:N-acetylmuramoyl-L-alanine amidase
MKLIAALAVSVMLLLGQSDEPSSHEVTAARHWSLNDVTRVAIEVGSSFEFHTDRLHNPERIYYDILNTHPNIDSKRFYAETVNDKLLQKIRIAEPKTGVTRVVLDLVGNADATASTLTNPYRLIIELRIAAGSPILTSPPTADASPRPATFKMPIAIKPVVTARIDAPPVEVPGPGENKDTKTDDGAAAVAPAVAPRPLAPATPEEFAKGARHNSSGENSLIRALGLKLNRVVIDPGHGGHDEGTAGAKGLLEKELVLDVALRVGKLVQERMNAEVIYTRSDDTFIPLEGRTALANEKKADLFLSIHANSSSVPNISGVETYYLNINGSRDAMDVASRENGATQRSIFELQHIIQKITLHDKSEESHEFAKRVEASLFSFNLKSFPANKDRGVKTAPFIVLIGASMPSVLAEIGFLSNAKEEQLLKKSDYRQKLAEALYKGLEKYAESLSHFQVAAAKP